MEGFIVNLNRVKEEDLIVSVISKKSLDTLYRFYGARHGVINLGFKIDYEKELSGKSSIGRLKDVIHIGFPWINDYKLLRLWQDFSALFYKHLKELEEIEIFYFELLEESSKKWHKQNPKRVAIESYIKLLVHEGRLHQDKFCFLCSREIKTEISLIRAFIPTHPTCSHSIGLNNKGLKELLENNTTLYLSDIEVENLWHVVLEGL